ncbi:TPA: hypothetical protein OBO95_003907 [Escherichia coli]|nr:hypothetical protein [Escherichia coli]
MTKIIAVTACPSGVAHTYMAAEALESAAKAKGWEVKVETQGSIGLENELTAEDVASADCNFAFFSGLIGAQFWAERAQPKSPELDAKLLVSC